MGMFDYVKSLHPLIPDAEYQTKYFDCGLDTFYITPGGRFILEKKDYNWRDEDPEDLEPTKYVDVELDGRYGFHGDSGYLHTVWKDGQLMEWYFDGRP